MEPSTLVLSPLELGNVLIISFPFLVITRYLPLTACACELCLYLTLHLRRASPIPLLLLIQSLCSCNALQCSSLLSSYQFIIYF